MTYRTTSNRPVSVVAAAFVAALAASCSQEQAAKPDSTKATATSAAPVAKTAQHIRDETKPIERRCAHDYRAVDNVFLVRVKRATPNLQGSVVHRYTPNGTFDDYENLNPPHPAKPEFGTAHDTHADLDAGPYLPRRDSMVLVVVLLDHPDLTFAEGKSITIEETPVNEMFCVRRPLDQQNGPKIRRFYVEHREKTGADSNIGNYYLWLKDKSKFVDIPLDPNIKNDG